MISKIIEIKDDCRKQKNFLSDLAYDLHTAKLVKKFDLADSDHNSD